MPDFKPGIYEDLDYPAYAAITVDGRERGGRMTSPL